MNREQRKSDSSTRQRRRWWVFLTLGLIGSTPWPLRAQTEVASWTVDGGGQTSSGGSFEVSGTLGQPDAISLTGGTFEVQSGFWTSENPFVPVELLMFEIAGCLPEQRPTVEEVVQATPPAIASSKWSSKPLPNLDRSSPSQHPPRIMTTTTMK